MCLGISLKINQKVSKRNATKAYKIFIINNSGFLTSPIKGPSKSYPKSKWIEDNFGFNLSFDHGTGENRTGYKSGFHAFASKKVALRELKAAKSKNFLRNKYFLYEVKLAGTVSSGIQTYGVFHRCGTNEKAYCGDIMRIGKKIE